MGLSRALILVLLIAAIFIAATGFVISHLQTAQLKKASVATPVTLQPAGQAAGAGPQPAIDDIVNPLAANPTDVAEGHRLFLSLNCAGCHGYDANGGMGPSLRDRAWRYGGTPGRLYLSILDGRPKGMPEWGQSIPQRSIWQLVSYIQSLGGTSPPSNPGSSRSGQGLGAQDGK